MCLPDKAFVTIVNVPAENALLPCQKIHRIAKRAQPLHRKHQPARAVFQLHDAAAPRGTLADGIACRFLPQHQLGREECDILCEAAGFLGRYDAAEQKAGLDAVLHRLQAARELAAAELHDRGSLCRTCGIAAGLLVILVLV